MEPLAFCGSDEGFMEFQGIYGSYKNGPFRPFYRRCQLYFRCDLFAKYCSL